MIYIVVIIIFIIGVYNFDIHNKWENKETWYKLECFLLILLSGLRYKVGGDTVMYMISYDDIPPLKQLTANFIDYSRYQPLWIYLCSALKSASEEFVLLQIVHAAIVNPVFFYFFKKHSLYPFSCTLIYAVFFFMNYNTEIMRAALSVSVFLISYDFIISKQWFKYLICTLIAVGFHSEALVMLIFPFCYFTFKFSVKKTMLVVLALFIIFNALDFIPIISDYLSFNEKIQEAFNKYSEGTSFSLNLTGTVVYVFKVIIWLLFLWLIKDKETYNRFFIILVLLATVFSYKYVVILGRALDFAYPLLILEFIDLISSRINFLKIIVVIGIIYAWGFFYFRPVGNSYSYRQYYPYSSILSPSEDRERMNTIYEYHQDL